MKTTARSQKAHVPSNRMMPCSRSLGESGVATATALPIREFYRAGALAVAV